MPEVNVKKFYYKCFLFAFSFPAIFLIYNFIAFPRVPDLFLERDLFQDFLIGGTINTLFLLPGMILPILILPCMLLLYGGVIIPTVVYSGYQVTFKAFFDYDISQFIWNTNWNQAYEFLASRLTPFAWGALSFVVFFPFLLMYWVLRGPKPINNLKRAFWLLPLLAFGLFYEGYFMRLHPQTQIRSWVDLNIRAYFFRYYAREFYKYRNMDAAERAMLRTMVQQPKEHFPLKGLRRVFGGEVN
ncbi:MAG: hypothetical protein LBJ22_01510, partial [Synergistaceae bacterium]|nr:hypothetical protein [Synergistaceae bacterium]